MVPAALAKLIPTLEYQYLHGASNYRTSTTQLVLDNTIPLGKSGCQVKLSGYRLLVKTVIDLQMTAGANSLTRCPRYEPKGTRFEMDDRSPNLHKQSA